VWLSTKKMKIFENLFFVGLGTELNAAAAIAAEECH
jgi:hypothetical protein